MRKIENLTIDEIVAWDRNEVCPNGGLRISWSANIGFGQYDIVFDENFIPHAYTEYMDHEGDKEFTKMILNALAERIIVEE